MVGVPGKSKACDNCRKRRVLCDFRRPSCGQCIRSKIECGGYERELIFLNSTSQQTQAGETVFKQETYLTSVTTKRAENISRTSTPTPPGETASLDGFIESNPPLLPLSLAQSAFEDNIIGNFWSSYLPNGEAASAYVFQYSTYGWTVVAQELYKENPLIRAAVLASAIGFTGQQQHLPDLVQQSRQLYGWVLMGVNRALREPAKQDTHIIQTALRLLGFYEGWCGSDDKDPSAQFRRWCTHAAGISAFLLHKGPESYIRGHAHRLFEDSRLIQVVACMKNRTPAPLARPEWKTIPWTEIEKGPRDTLFDILLDFPGLCCDFNNAYERYDAAERTELHEKAAAQSWALDCKLQTWALTDGREALKLASGKIDQDKSISGNGISTEKFAMGHLVLMYWTACIILYDTIRNNTEPPHGEWLEHMDPLLYCRKMGDFIPFLLVPNVGSAFGNMAMLPLAIALRYLSAQEKGEPSEEKVVLLRALQGHPGKVAWNMLASLQSMNSMEGRPLLE